MSRAKGDEAESKAVKFLEKNSFFIVEQNFYSRFGELDIIATKDGTLHFIEVKSATNYELAVQNITKTKLTRLIKTIHTYIKKYNIKDTPYTLDAIIVTPSSIEFIENITI